LKKLYFLFVNMNNVDKNVLSMLSDLRVLVCQRNPVKGTIVCIIADVDGEILSWGFVRSLTIGMRDRKRKLSGQSTDIHAEADAISALVGSGKSMKEASLYVSSVCCKDCFALAVNSGIRRFLFPEPDPSYYTTHRKRIATMARFHEVTVIETPPLRPYRRLKKSFLLSLPPLSRAWGKGGNVHDTGEVGKKLDAQDCLKLSCTSSGFFRFICITAATILLFRLRKYIDQLRAYFVSS